MFGRRCSSWLVLADEKRGIVMDGKVQAGLRSRGGGGSGEEVRSVGLAKLASWDEGAAGEGRRYALAGRAGFRCDSR
jgi:hypothetical protein